MWRKFLSIKALLVQNLLHFHFYSIQQLTSRENKIISLCKITSQLHTHINNFIPISKRCVCKKKQILLLLVHVGTHVLVFYWVKTTHAWVMQIHKHLHVVSSRKIFCVFNVDQWLLFFFLNSWLFVARTTKISESLRKSAMRCMKNRRWIANRSRRTH